MQATHSLKQILIWLGAFTLLSLAGCNPVVEEGAESPEQTGLSFNLRISSRSDVVAMRFSLSRKSCSGEEVPPFSLSIDKSLEEILLPGGIPGFEDTPLDQGSAHAFADLFLTLEPGCYDVTTYPLRDGGALSQQCAPASARGVRIHDKQTTEIFLINQCQGDKSGAIDVVSALNHPPEISAVVFEHSKFVLRCGPQVICATAKDPDNDPIEFVWRQVGGPLLLSGPTVVRTTSNPDGSTTQCVRAVAEQTGQHLLAVNIYDLLHDPSTSGGGLIRFEDYFLMLGEAVSSHAELTFPFYSASNGYDGPCYSSCKDIHERQPELPSGVYAVDLDGVGPAAPLDVYCDMTSDGGGWTLVMNQVPTEWLPNNLGTVNPGNFGSLTKTYRLGSDIIKTIRPTVAWLLTDNSNRVYYQSDCIVDWENNMWDQAVGSCNQGFNALGFASPISPVRNPNGSRGIGQNNYGNFCSIRAFTSEGGESEGWPPGPAASCAGNRYETIRLWFK